MPDSIFHESMIQEAIFLGGVDTSVFLGMKEMESVLSL